MSDKKTIKAVAFTGQRRAEVIDLPPDVEFGPTEVTGRTLATLVSPGTEVNGMFDVPREAPAVGGYACVFEVDAVGSKVTDIAVGQRVFASGGHTSRQRHDRLNVLPIPSGLSAEKAVFARLMGVTWSTLTTTTARPSDRVVITGLGIVGNLAAQLFTVAGYEVTAVDPIETRRRIARQCGVRDARPAMPLDDKALVDHVALVVDCTGYEAAVLDACKIVRKRGEVVLVGVPWKKRADTTAFEILHAVFHRYVILRSGWEWEVPRQPTEFMNGSIAANLAGALRWIAEGRIKVDALFRHAAPVEAQIVYDDLLAQRGEHLSVVFDWSKV